MIDAPSSTWFSASPHWSWYIILYFFIGGLAGGCYFIASMIDNFRGADDRRIARLLSAATGDEAARSRSC